MKFRVQAKDLAEALKIVGIVTPRPVTPQGGSGYLFVVKDGSCSIYSQDELRRSKTSVEVFDSDGEGSFIYPADKISGLSFIDGWIEFESGHDEDEDRYWVSYTSEGGAKGGGTTYDPVLMRPMDEDLKRAVEKGHSYSFPVALLKEGIDSTKPYMAKLTDDHVDDQYKTIQLFDTSKEEWAKGDGHLFAADNVRCCFFFCEAFRGKRFSLHGQHLAYFSSFLSKCEGSTVTVISGETMTFVVDSLDRALGWTHHVRRYEKYSYYPMKMDKFLLRADKHLIVKALKHARSELDKRKDTVRISYTHEDTTLRFQATESSWDANPIPVGVEPLEDDGGAGKNSKTQDFSANVSVDSMLDMFDPMKDHQVVLRIAVIPSKREDRQDVVLFRTIEKFWMGATGKVLVAQDDSEGSFECRVTRFLPSKG